METYSSGSELEVGSSISTLLDKTGEYRKRFLKSEYMWNKVSIILLAHYFFYIGCGSIYFQDSCFDFSCLANLPL